MRAVHLNSAKELAGQLAVAESFAGRLKGLLGRTTLPWGAGLWIKKCSCIHTFGMQFPIDALFLDRENQVVGLAENLAPNRLSRWYCRASSVIELPAGTLQAVGTRPGDRITVVPGPPPQSRYATE